MIGKNGRRALEQLIRIRHGCPDSQVTKLLTEDGQNPDGTH